MQIISDAWAFLASRVGSDGTLRGYAPGDDASSHPRVDEAAEYATRTVENGLQQQYTQDSIDAFTAADADAEMRYHWGSLALYALTSTGGGRSQPIETDNTNALGWLRNVRTGQLTVDGLTKIADTIGTGTSDVSATRRLRYFDEDDNPDFKARNESI